MYRAVPAPALPITVAQSASQWLVLCPLLQKVMPGVTAPLSPLRCITVQDRPSTTHMEMCHLANAARHRSRNLAAGNHWQC